MPKKPKKPKFRRTAHVFEPPSPVEAAGSNSRLLGKMRRTVERIDLQSSGPLTPGEISSLHPVSLKRLSRPLSRAELARHHQDILRAQELAVLPVRGLRFMPAEVNLHPVVEARLPDSYDREAMFPEDPPAEEQVKSSLYNRGVLGAHVRFMPEGAYEHQRPQMVAHIDMPEPGTFVVGPYGLKGSPKPDSLPESLQRHYLPGAAPSLGLALILARLRARGAKRVIIPGETHMHEDVGAKQWQVKHNVKAIADGKIVPPGVDRAKASGLAADTLRRWEKLPAEEVYERLGRMGAGLARSLALNPGVIRRYYRNVPLRFGAVPIEYPKGYPDANLLEKRHLAALRPLSGFMKKKQD